MPVYLQDLEGVSLSAHRSPFANLLVTKLTAPIDPLKTVQRKRLTDRVQEGMFRRLTLVVAPAGYGKTTLLREWTSKVQTSNWQVAWLQLDKGDNGVQFWIYFIGALQTIDSNISLDLLEEIEAFVDFGDCRQLNHLLNQIALIPRSFSIILDDYQEIQTEMVHKGLTYLIDHMPGNMHMIIASRTTPPFPFARWRIRQQLTEVLASDLSFNHTETKEFLDSVMGLRIADSDITTLIKMTEGWIAGIQMAVLSMQGRHDIKDFLNAFSGEFHLILDYLTEEVLSQQTNEIRNFLLSTSILISITAQLCDEILDRNDSQQNLEYLEQANLFIVPLDKQRRWYRYHPLFRDYLKLSLERTSPEIIPQMHQKACDWLQRNGYPELAIPHAFAREDFEKAASNIEACILQNFLRSDLQVILQWAEQLPKEIFLKQPRLVILMILARVAFAQRNELTATLIDLNEVLSQASDSEKSLTDDSRMLHRITMIKGVIACIQSDYEQAIELADKTLPSMETQDYYLAGMLFHFVHYAYLAAGDLDKASEMLSTGLQISRAYKMEREHLSSMCSLARIFKYRGWLEDARKTLQNALDYAYEQAAGLKAISLIKVELANIHLEWGQIESADRLISDAQQFISYNQMSFLEWNFTPDIFLIMARFFMLKEKFGEAKEYIDATKLVLQKYYRIPYLSAQTKSLEVRYWLVQGDIDRVARWVFEIQERLLGSGEHVSAIEIITFARASLRLGRLKQASDVIGMLSRKAIRLPIVQYQIEMHLVKAQILFYSGKRAGAKASFLTAARLAEPGGFVQFFLDEGPALKPILQETWNDLQTGRLGFQDYSSLSGFIKRLYLYCIPVWGIKRATVEKLTTPLQVLNEALSEREIDVIKLMANGCYPRQIASQLCISINTTRTHIKNIYRKLDVHNREKAIEKAVFLNLL